MLSFTFKRMIKNKWLTLSLLLGFMLSIAIIVSIPMYSSASLKKVLAEDLEKLKEKDKINPGVFYLNRDIYSAELDGFGKIITKLEQATDNTLQDMFLKALDSKREILCKDMSIGNIDEYGHLRDEHGGSYILKSINNITDHVDFIEGTAFSNNLIENDIAEAIVSERTFKQMNLKLDKIYFIKKQGSLEDPIFIKFKVCGVYKPKNENEPYWADKNLHNVDSIIISESIMKNNIASYVENPLINNCNIYRFIDYKNINISKLSTTLDSFKKSKTYIDRDLKAKINFSSLNVMETYIEKASKLRSTLLAIEIPIILLIAIYIIMVCKIVINSTTNEVSVLKSRGFNNFNIFKIYFIQNLILSIIGGFLGCGLAIIFCKIIGCSNGFLEFANRSFLDISIGKMELIYCFILMVIFLIITSIPIITYTNGSIVVNKRKNIRKSKSIIKRFYLDFILFGLSIYLIYNQKTLYKILNLNVKDQSLTIPPIMYINFTLFSISLALICLRFYPYLIKLILLLGKRRWSPEAYASLINVSRTRDNNFLIIFLIITLSTGIFNLKSASTINQYEENKVKYLLGADIVVRPWWLEADDKSLDAIDSTKINSKSFPNLSDTHENFPLYKEPETSNFYSIEGIESTTKVFINNTGKISFNEKTLPLNTQIIGIIPDEFGKTAWFNPDFLQYHWYYYLNFMSSEPKAVLLSKNLEKNHNIKLGDTIYIHWKGSLYIETVVYGFVDYWPSYNKTTKGNESFVVANFNYLSSITNVQPYEIWMKKSPNLNSGTIYKNINNKNLNYENLKTIDQSLYDLKTDPMLQGMNGTLSLCFIASLIITCMGFIIYWALAIKSRTLQFGILRAMGLKLKKLIFMLIYEQALTSGIAIIIGSIIGEISSNIFVPMLNSTKKLDQVIPFIVENFANDYITLILFMIILLSTSLLILIKIIKQIDINQALKLGED